MRNHMQILAISGSLRAASINSALLRTIKRLAPPDVRVDLCREIGDLPLFNPDLDAAVPGVVDSFRRRVSAADALLVASPEYAHGVTGTMKNALDWLVSHEGFANKPVAVLNTSPRAMHADAALRETLKTMAAQIVEASSLTFPLLGYGLDERAMLTAEHIVVAIQSVFDGLRRHVPCSYPHLT